MPDNEYLIHESFNTTTVSIEQPNNILELSSIKIFSFSDINNNKQKLGGGYN